MTNPNSEVDTLAEGKGDDVYDLLKKLATSDDDVALQWKPGDHPGVVLAIDSEKGGVGKTGMVTGLTAVAAQGGLSVLVIDLDPRATATAELGVDNAEFTVNDILYTSPEEVDPNQIRGGAVDAIVASGEGWPENVHVIASERNLGHREMDPTDGMEYRLKLALEGVAERYDLVLIDLPPRAGGKLVTVAFHAATHVLFPATLDEDGYIGAKDARTTVTRLLAYHPGSVKILGVVRNIVDRRATSLGQMFDQKLRAEFGAELVEEAAVAMYIVRKEARAICIPFTTVTSPEVSTLARGYKAVLNYVWKAI